MKPGTYAHFDTSMGKFTIELFETQAPNTVGNFVGLAEGTKEWKDSKTGQPVKGKPFYDGVIFHRVIDGFMIQGGDPTGTGMGGPGYRFENETHPSVSHASVGVLAMANAGPNTNGSQFYITIDSLRPEHVKMLDGNYTIFGQVTKGNDVASKIAVGDKIESIEILDSPEALFIEQKSRLKEWNTMLDRKFGNKLEPPVEVG